MNKVGAQITISLSIILPFWGLVYLAFFYGREMDPNSREMFNGVMLQVIPLIAGIVGFWVGSSYSSGKKDDTIADMVSKEKV